LPCFDAQTSRLTLSAQAIGTLAYMAPEQFGDVKNADAPADVYELAKIL
jgi:serine/threonine protein kinase